MGARLARKDRLVREGITPIPPEQGVAILLQLLRQPAEVVSVVVMGRYSDLPTFKIERPELPFLRFLEKIKVYYPGIELIVDVDLSRDTDPYLDDHSLQGRRLLPAVMGLEAMAQVAAALVGSPALPTFKGIEFSRPVVVSESAALPIDVAQEDIVFVTERAAKIHAVIPDRQLEFWVRVRIRFCIRRLADHGVYGRRAFLVFLRVCRNTQGEHQKRDCASGCSRLPVHCHRPQ